MLLHYAYIKTHYGEETYYKTITEIIDRPVKFFFDLIESHEYEKVKKSVEQKREVITHYTKEKGNPLYIKAKDIARVTIKSSITGYDYDTDRKRIKHTKHVEYTTILTYGGDSFNVYEDMSVVVNEMEKIAHD